MRHRDLVGVTPAATCKRPNVAALTVPDPPGLNVESGINDCVRGPLLFIALAVAEADAGSIGDAHAVRLVVEQIGYGVCGGVIGGVVTAAAVVVARRPTVAFMGWFGPRGLASIVFALIVLNEAQLPHVGTILSATYAIVSRCSLTA